MLQNIIHYSNEERTVKTGLVLYADSQ